MNKIISKTIEIKTPKIMPPTSDYIENEIKKQGVDPIRWAIVDVKEKKDNTKTDSIIILSVSGEYI